MKKKILFCATVDYHIKLFHIPYLKWFKENGWEVHVAANGDMELPIVDKKYNIQIQRTPINIKNLRAYFELKEIIEKNKYNIIHCHTPMGGVLARLVARKTRKNGTKIIYTAHGFHFYEGAPILNWVVYYPIEKWLANYTDCLITINQEDFHRAIKSRFNAGKIEYVHGVGVDTEKFRPRNKTYRNELRKLYGYKDNDFLMFYAAEFNKNKNQQLLIKVLAKLKFQLPNARLLLAGDGPLKKHCQNLAMSLGVYDMVDFLGFRKDIDIILPMCDLALASSIREGLPVNIMEAMACGLPVVASDNRGHRELVYNDKNGWVISGSDVDGMAEKILIIFKNEELRKKFGCFSRRLVECKFSLQKIIEKMGSIYSEYIN